MGLSAAGRLLVATESTARQVSRKSDPERVLLVDIMDRSDRSRYGRPSGLRRSWCATANGCDAPRTSKVSRT